jgi:hypothetical protein
MERKSKKKHHKIGGGLLPGDMETLISLFKDQCISFKEWKIWAVLRDGIWRLAGLINRATSHNMGYFAHVLMLGFLPLFPCGRQA